MKKILFLLLIANSSLTESFGQLTAFSQYWQQQVNYSIDVKLDDKENVLDGYERIEYINNSPDTIKFIWFHLWPNAYKNDKTAFSDQLLENGNTEFYFSNKEQRGYINRLDFKVNNTTAQVEDHPQFIDVVKIILPVPIPPGQKTIITTPFHVKLPYNYSRGGHDGQSYQVTQWFPKPAVYDKLGWHPMPYLDQGEFYSEFGSFDVTITVPSNYVVAATGELQDEKEKAWMKARSGFTWEPIHEKKKIKGGGTKTIIIEFPESDKRTKTLEYKQDNIHDFAWFADKRFIVNYDTCKLASGKVIDVYTYYTPKEKKTWGKSNQFCKNAVRHYSSLVGEYPYAVVSAVQGPASFGGGMEYPTITIVSPETNEKNIDLTIAHEVGHNWFYGILASNERDHPWMDEGINTYYDNKYARAWYPPQNQLERIGLETRTIMKTDQPIEIISEKFNIVNYDLVAYYKTGAWLRYLESIVGTVAYDKAMHDYYSKWKFRHPQPDDFRVAITESTGKNLDSVFGYLNKKGIVPGMERKGSKTLLAFQISKISTWLKAPSKDVLLMGPALGFNDYDKLMIGAFFTNYKLPPSHFQYFLAPMYSTGAKEFAGLGTLKYSSYSDHGLFRRTDLFVNASRFSYDEFLKLDKERLRFQFLKVSGGLRLTAREKDPRSTMHKFIQWKSYFFNEETYGQIKYDTLINLPDTIITQRVPIKNTNRYLNQLRLVLENNRALYPYSGELKAEQGKDFIRTDFTGKYFFNYPHGGGLEVRLFAGKFFYTGSKTTSKQFATDRYHLNMTGSNGMEDYTYSEYFIGRNKFNGMASQQIMMKDGGFKVRTDLNANKIGKTDDWLIAANFSTTVPKQINPLNLLPIKIPLKLFADIGTSAEAWQKDSETDHFIFDAGLQVSLFRNTIDIYFPLIYSDVFKNYIESTIPKNGRFFKKVSFTINLSQFKLRAINSNLDF